MSRRAAAALTCLIAGLTVAAADDGAFSVERAMTHLRFLSDIPGSRYNGTQGESRARDYIARELGRAGLEVSREPVARIGEVFIGSENVIGVLRGRADRTILISAHHDTANPYTPGAGDDASGIAVMLETARLLSASPPLASVVFVSFCAEHAGLAGSRSHLAGRETGDLLAVLNLQDVGRKPISFLFPDRSAPLWAARALSWSLRGGVVGDAVLDPLPVLAPRIFGAGARASHEPFERRGVPSLTIAGSVDPWTRETPLDTVSRIDPHALRTAGRLLMSLVRRVDALPPGSIASSRYVPLTVGGRLFIVTAPAIIVLAVLLAVLGAIWWRVFWWKARRRGRRLVLPDAFRALARAGIAVTAAAGMAMAGEECIMRLSAAGPPGAFEGTIRLLLLLAFLAAGLGAGWLLVGPLRRASEVEMHTVLPCLVWAGGAWAALGAGRADLAFYFLVPPTFAVAVSILAPRWAGLGALAGCAPMAALLKSPSLPGLLEATRDGIGSWPAFLLLVLVTTPLAVAMGRTFSLPGRRVARAVLGCSAAAILVLIGAGLAGGTRPAGIWRRVRIEERIEAAGPAGLRLASEQGLAGVGGLPVPGGGIDTNERAVEISLPEAGDGRLLDVLIEVQPVESVHLAGVSGVKDVRVILLPGFIAERVEVTLRADSEIEVLDGGSWSRGDRFTRVLAYPAGPEDPAVITFRVAGRPGGTVTLETRAMASRDLLGLSPLAEHSLLTWRAEVLREDRAGL